MCRTELSQPESVIMGFSKSKAYVYASPLHRSRRFGDIAEIVGYCFHTLVAMQVVVVALLVQTFSPILRQKSVSKEYCTEGFISMPAL